MIEFNATLIIAMISFVVFMFIMNAIFYRPILGIIQKRKEYIDDNYKEAKQLSENAQNLTEEFNRKLNEAAQEAKKHIEAETEKMRNLESSKIQKAKEDSGIEFQSRKEILEKDKQDIRNEIDKNYIDNLASDIVLKVTGIR